MQNYPQELIDELKTEYVAIGNHIKHAFNLHANEENYFVEYVYCGYHTHDIKFDNGGEGTYFVLTDKKTGSRTNVGTLKELVEGGIYSTQNLISIWTELIKLAAIESSLNSLLKTIGSQTEVSYMRELFIQNFMFEMFFKPQNSN